MKDHRALRILFLANEKGNPRFFNLNASNFFPCKYVYWKKKIGTYSRHQNVIFVLLQSAPFVFLQNIEDNQQNSEGHSIKSFHLAEFLDILLNPAYKVKSQFNAVLVISIKFYNQDISLTLCFIKEKPLDWTKTESNNTSKC